MSELFLSKVVSTLPTPLDANALYLVKVGTGFRPYVTNSTGTIVAYGLNPIDWSELTGKPTLLVASNNLSDVTTPATARTNLGTPYLRAITQFTTSGTWTKPAGLAHVVVEVWGGGGGSAGTDVFPTGNGGVGGTTLFGGHVGSIGGGGGGAQYGFGGQCGVGSGGDLNFAGGSGSFGQAAGGSAPRGGGGGASFAGGQTGGFPGGGAGSNGATRGAGGGGGYSRKKIAAASLGSSETVTVGSAGTAGTGGSDGAAGAGGLVIVEEWGY